MKRIAVRALWWTMIVAIVFVVVSPLTATGDTIIVPDDYPTIQLAVDAAGPGDTVYVHAGTYYEHITIGKSLTLQGEDRETTVIDGNGSGNVIYINTSYVTISGFMVTNGENGIDLISDSTINHITIRDVTITSNNATAFSAPHSGGYHLIEDCIISNNGGGASYAHQFGNSIIRNCEVFGNGGGFSVAWGSGTLITNNKVHHNTGGGIHFDSMSYSTIEKNNVYSNGGSGISVGYVGDYNTIRDNIVYQNDCGICMGGPYVSDNEIYHNDLIENTTQAYDAEGDNIWDDGYPSGGNYWSDYSGADTYSGPGQNQPGSDGIGDTPYVFDNHQDNYPLMRSVPIRGDVNQDGLINILDALRTINIILGVQPPPTQDEMWAADCNGDVQINVLDVLGIINVILGIGTCVSPCEGLDCDDGNPCTDDSCNTLTGECEHINNTVPCDDGDPCTENDICQNGSCTGTPKDCNDGNPCTEDSCNPLTGECEHAFICDTTCTTVTDIDGNTYQAIQIGDQCWMAENLKVTHYRNGDPIPIVTDATEWYNLTTGAYCSYDNDADNVATYGRLYNWYAVDDSRIIAPAGWHVPTDEEWKQLEMHLGMSQSEADDTWWRGTDEGGKLKEAGTTHWNSPNTGATNESGFSALPGGYRNLSGSFNSLGYDADFWSSTENDSGSAWLRYLYYGSSDVYRDGNYKQHGFSLRCVRDTDNTPPTASFTVDPTSGTTLTMFTVNASGSYDNEDATSDLQVRWDWENDGTYDTAWSTTKTASHQYSTTGTKTIKLEVQDSGGLTDTETHQVTVSPSGCSTVTDIDGNTYQTIQIGEQCWMAENLKVTRYRNGDAIPNVTDNTEWTGLSTGAYCNYDNDVGNVATYGRLYNWFAVDDSRSIAPTGWHVPTDEEWKQLEMYLGMSQSEADEVGWRGTDEGGKMKEAGTSHWNSPNTGATNESGFSALPGGYRIVNDGRFYNLGYNAFFWSSSEYTGLIAWFRYLHYDSSDVDRDHRSKRHGCSLRCVRD